MLQTSQIKLAALLAQVVDHSTSWGEIIFVLFSVLLVMRDSLCIMVSVIWPWGIFPQCDFLYFVCNHSVCVYNIVSHVSYQRCSILQLYRSGHFNCNDCFNRDGYVVRRKNLVAAKYSALEITLLNQVL